MEGLHTDDPSAVADAIRLTSFRIVEETALNPLELHGRPDVISRLSYQVRDSAQGPWKVVEFNGRLQWPASNQSQVFEHVDLRCTSVATENTS